MAKISVIGGGAWGTALASVLSKNGENVLIYARETDAVKSINESNENKLFLPDIKLPPSLKATSDLDEVLKSKVILITTPTQFFRKQVEEIAKRKNNESIFLICSKGVENDSLALVSDMFEENLKNTYAILSGPTFAEEVAEGINTGVSLACRDQKKAEEVKAIIQRDNFRVHINNDVVGSQVCGAMKNVIAIGCGIVRGLGQGENSKAAILTLGFYEILQVNNKLGGKIVTMAEVCGIGDLVLTCNSEKSRNFSFGSSLGKGMTKEQILQGRLSVVEGVATAKSVVALAKKLGIELPLCTKIHDIIENKAKSEEILALV